MNKDTIAYLQLKPYSYVDILSKIYLQVNLDACIYTYKSTEKQEEINRSQLILSTSLSSENIPMIVPQIRQKDEYYFIISITSLLELFHRVQQVYYTVGCISFVYQARG